VRNREGHGAEQGAPSTHCRQAHAADIDRPQSILMLCVDGSSAALVEFGGKEQVMPLTKEEVLSGLEGVASPDGKPLPKAGKLSDILVTDGKVFFSITVDAAAVPSWEPVRKAAEAAVRALPGVTSVMIALTAERAPGAAPRPSQPAMGQGRAAPHGEQAKAAL